MHSDEEHIEIRNKLQKLPKMKASENFLASLQVKINLLQPEKSEELHHKEKILSPRESFIARLLWKRKNPWLVPAMSFMLVLFVVFTVFYYNIQKGIISPDITKLDKQTAQTESSKQAPSMEKSEIKDNSGIALSENEQEELSDKISAPKKTITKDKVSEIDALSPAPTEMLKIEQSVSPDGLMKKENESGKTVSPSKRDVESGNTVTPSKKGEPPIKISDEKKKEEKSLPKPDNKEKNVTKPSPNIKEQESIKTGKADDINKNIINPQESKDKDKKAARDTQKIEKKDLEKLKEKVDEKKVDKKEEKKDVKKEEKNIN